MVREWINRLFSAKQFLPQDFLEWVKMAEWSLIQRSAGIGMVWLQCPACEVVIAFKAADVGLALSRPSTRPWLKCECDFTPYLPDDFDWENPTIHPIIILKSEEDEDWIKIDRSSADKEDDYRLAEDGSVRRQDPRQLRPVERPAGYHRLL